MKYLFVLSLVLATTLVYASQNPLFWDDPSLPEDIVRTQWGLLKGEITQDYRVFRGIPYALPPVGRLRFAESTPWNRTWNSVRDATKFRNPCPHFLTALVTGFDEDCLFLNVWTPRRNRMNRPLPVYFFSPGGAFVLGNGNYDAQKLFDAALTHNHLVILVTHNYRLGPFGFLALPELYEQNPNFSTTGNYGLCDQTNAFEFVRQNIGAFGGDPGVITFVGASAGGISICAFLTSPFNQYFDRAIMQSGFCNLLPLEDAYTNGRRLVQALGCDSNTPSQVVECIRSVSSFEICLADLLTSYPITNETVTSRVLEWWPVIDGTIFKDQPYKLIRNGDFRPIPIIVGSNANETSPLIYLFFHGINDQSGYMETLVTYFGSVAAPLIAAQYPLSNFEDPQKALTALTSDYIFHCPAFDVAKYFTQYGVNDTYLYLFKRASGLSGIIAPELGAYHGTELPYLMDMGPLSFLAGPIGPQEYYLSKEMGLYWLHFVALGTPNDQDTRVHWPIYDGFAENLDIDVGLKMKLARSFTTFKCDFWDDIQPVLGEEGALEFHRTLRKQMIAMEALAALGGDDAQRLIGPNFNQFTTQLLHDFRQKFLQVKAEMNQP